MNWPDWWDWEIELTPHVEKRMTQRGFNELALRGMIQRARGLAQDTNTGHYVVDTTLRGARWAVIVEPDPDTHTVIIITAYTVS